MLEVENLGPEGEVRVLSGPFRRTLGVSFKASMWRSRRTSTFVEGRYEAKSNAGKLRGEDSFREADNCLITPLVKG
jgi:hypothetical protein